MSKVYSHVRFSSKAQEFGHSQRRQVTRAREYCRKHGLRTQPLNAWRVALGGTAQSEGVEIVVIEAPRH